MTKTFSYKIRAGNSIPIVPDGGTSSSKGNIIFTFGTEKQEILNCGSDRDVLSSDDMCLLGGEYFSASYSALPAKVNGQLRFVSSLAKAPIISAKYDTGKPCGQGSPVAAADGSEFEVDD